MVLGHGGAQSRPLEIRENISEVFIRQAAEECRIEVIVMFVADINKSLFNGISELFVHPRGKLVISRQLEP